MLSGRQKILNRARDCLKVKKSEIGTNWLLFACVSHSQEIDVKGQVCNATARKDHARVSTFFFISHSLPYRRIVSKSLFHCVCDATDEPHSEESLLWHGKRSHACVKYDKLRYSDHFSQTANGAPIAAAPSPGREETALRLRLHTELCACFNFIPCGRSSCEVLHKV